MKEEWKEKLQERLADYEESVPADLWTGIEQALDASEAEKQKTAAVPTATPAVQKRPRIIIMRSLAAAACVLLCLGLFIYNNVGEQSPDAPSVAIAPANGHNAGGGVGEKNTETASLESSDEGGKLLAAVSSGSNSGVEADITGHLKAAGNCTALTATKVGSHEPNGAGSKAAAANAEATGNGSESTGKTDEPKGGQTAPKATGSESVVVNREKRPTQNQAQPSVAMGNGRKSTHRAVGADGRLTASLFAANSMSGAASQTGGMHLLSSSNVLLASAQEGNAEQKAQDYLVGSENANTVKHHQPVRLGVSARYALTSKLGISAGVTYSRLSSDLSTTIDNSRHATEQVLHFVGIPVDIDYTLWSCKLLRLYVQAGGMVEKSVKGKATTTYLLNETPISSSSSDVEMKELQWSANAAAGVQLNVTRNVGLYAEPGVGYYFDNGSQVRTAYSEKPFNFNLKFGLRYSF